MNLLHHRFYLISLIFVLANLINADNKGDTSSTETSKDIFLKTKAILSKKPIPSDKKVPVKLEKAKNGTQDEAGTTAPQPEDVGYSAFPEALDPDITPPPNINITLEEDHQYYSSLFDTADHDRAQQYWVDFEDPAINRHATVHSLLSNSYRRAATVKLSFNFPFYGHLLRNITLATGGFLFTGGYLHTWLANTQYIAPLMGNFDTSLRASSVIRFADNGSAFTVEWKDVMLKERQDDGGFTFQTTLFNNGDIVFVYKKVPFPVTEINNFSHPVKVGLADAYTIEKSFFHVKKKTIYEYHRVDLKRNDITNDTVIYFTAAPTCLQFTDCTSCLASKIGFECQWCDLVERCSDGTDRYRQEWLHKSCHNLKEAGCSSTNPIFPPTSTGTSSEQPSSFTYLPVPKAHKKMCKFPGSLCDEQSIGDNPKSPMLERHVWKVIANTTPAWCCSPLIPLKVSCYSAADKEPSAVPKAAGGGIRAGELVVLLVVLGMLASGAVWGTYAYCYPHTASGQCLIRYRPSQWRFGHGEARYTAASIHM